MSITNLTAPELRELISKYQSELRKLEYQASKTYATIQELEDVFYQSSSRSERPILPSSMGAAQTTTTSQSPPAESPPKKKRGRKPKVKALEETTESAIEKPSESGRRQSSKPARVVSATGAQDDVFTILPKKTPKKRKPAQSKGKRKRVVKTDGYRLSDWDTFIVRSLEDTDRILRNADFYELAKEWIKTTGEEIDNTEIRGKISRSIHKLANKRGYIIKVKYPGRGNAYALPDWFTKDGKLKKMHADL
ncbi:MAG: hypothetical protein EA409_03985 [Saprospirales bacterium]|nr:MAG: hypothetical protein EA409_03985 [Saprospirales bacterium]